ncbi:MAG: hypothetical protein BWY66_01147 [bacterium ADurb.Bin374]|nr:MAG: hypothetical protein BWY66_01147 [bacterium ADurb.Bin374]
MGLEDRENGRNGDEAPVPRRRCVRVRCGRADRLAVRQRAGPDAGDALGRGRLARHGRVRRRSAGGARRPGPADLPEHARQFHLAAGPGGHGRDAPVFPRQVQAPPVVGHPLRGGGERRPLAVRRPAEASRQAHRARLGLASLLQPRPGDDPQEDLLRRRQRGRPHRLPPSETGSIASVMESDRDRDPRRPLDGALYPARKRALRAGGPPPGTAGRPPRGVGRNDQVPGMPGRPACRYRGLDELDEGRSAYTVAQDAGDRHVPRHCRPAGRHAVRLRMGAVAGDGPPREEQVGEPAQGRPLGRRLVIPRIPENARPGIRDVRA